MMALSESIPNHVKTFFQHVSYEIFHQRTKKKHHKKRLSSLACKKNIQDS